MEKTPSPRPGSAARACLLALCLGLALAGCFHRFTGPRSSRSEIAAEAREERALVIETRLAALRRAQRIALRIALANVELCQPQGFARGGFAMTLANDYAVPSGQSALQQLLGRSQHDDRLKVLATPGDDLPSQDGLHEGDIVLRIGGEEAPRGMHATERAETVLRRAAAAGGPVPFTIERAGTALELTATPVPMCDLPLVLAASDEINALADGRRITVFTGMEEFARSDGELAAIIGHESAHLLRKHVRLVKLGVRSGPLAQNLEREADYIGLYLAARAGYQVDDSANFWRRIAVKYSETAIRSSYLASHPASPERFLALEKTVAEIKAKQAANQPLLPELH
jgi:Zn-dependent protease with chaperone function